MAVVILHVYKIWNWLLISVVISVAKHIQDDQSLTRTGSFQTRSRKPVLKRFTVAVDKPSRDHSVLVNFTVSVVVGLRTVVKRLADREELLRMCRWQCTWMCDAAVEATRLWLLMCSCRVSRVSPHCRKLSCKILGSFPFWLVMDCEETTFAWPHYMWMNLVRRWELSCSLYKSLLVFWNTFTC